MGVGPGNVVAPARHIRDGDGRDKGHPESDEAEEGLSDHAQAAGIGQHGNDGGNRCGAAAHGVDVVQVSARVFNVGRADARALEHRQISQNRANPGDGDRGVDRQHGLQRLENPHQRQQQRNQHAEDQPDHAPRVVVGQTYEAVGPGQRAAIGVGHIDLDLREGDKNRRQAQGQRRLLHDLLVGMHKHMHGLHGLGCAAAHAQCQHGQQAACCDLERTNDNPARARCQQCQPPGAAVLRRFLGQEAQIVHLLADLRHQRKQHTGSSAEHQQIEAPGIATQTFIADPGAQQGRVLVGDEQQGQDQHDHPGGLRPDLQFADGRDAKEHQRDDDQRAQQIPQRQLQAQGQM